MPNSWDTPPPPERGDQSDSVLFEAVGRALTMWEALEECWAGVFACFTGHGEFYFLSPAVRAYGAATGFTVRQGMLEAAAVAHFHSFPDQDADQEFRRLVRLTVNFSARRNEIAHGRVKYLNAGAFARGAGFHLVPAGYNTKKRPIHRPPAYAYSSAEVGRLRSQFKEIGDAVWWLRSKIDTQQEHP